MAFLMQQKSHRSGAYRRALPILNSSAFPCRRSVYDEAEQALKIVIWTMSKPAKLQEFLPRSIPMMKMSIGLFLSI
jgi:hypothetical protein